MAQDRYVSAYLEKPLRTLRRACVEAAVREGRSKPDCGRCPLKDQCTAELRRLRRRQKKAMLAAARAHGLD